MKRSRVNRVVTGSLMRRLREVAFVEQRGRGKLGKRRTRQDQTVYV